LRYISAAAIAWHEDRRKWVGDKSQHPPRIAKDQIIRYNKSQLPFFSFTVGSIIVIRV